MRRQQDAARRQDMRKTGTGRDENREESKAQWAMALTLTAVLGVCTF